MTIRVQCCVPGCTHTRGDRKRDPLPRPPATFEWICAAHWRPVPKRWRRVYAVVNQRAHRTGAEAHCDFARKLWERVKAMAIERAVGLA